MAKSSINSKEARQYAASSGNFLKLLKGKINTREYTNGVKKQASKDVRSDVARRAATG